MDSVYNFTKERLPVWVSNFYNQVSDIGELGVISWCYAMLKISGVYEFRFYWYYASIIKIVCDFRKRSTILPFIKTGTYLI